MMPVELTLIVFLHGEATPTVGAALRDAYRIRIISYSGRSIRSLFCVSDMFLLDFPEE